MELPSGFARTSYKGFKLLRSKSNSDFTAYEDKNDNSIILTTVTRDGNRICCNLDTLNPDPEVVADVQDYRDALESYANTPMEISEVRFYTHDFADASTWNGKTCGDPSAPYVGGEAVHPLTGLWLDATGAAMLQAYGTEGSPYYQNPQMLYGSLGNMISAQYDDINYRWVDNLENSWKNDPSNFPFTTHCWLDLSPVFASASGTGIWRDGATNESVCVFDAEQGPDQIKNDGTTKKRGSWICNLPVSGTVDATSSRWRIDPYDGKKVELREVGMDVELGADLEPGHFFRWKPYGIPSEAQQAQLEAMGLPEQVAQLPFEGTEFVYHTISDFRFGCNEYNQSIVPEPGAVYNTVSMVYNYTKTVIPVIDARQKQRLDIIIDGDRPVNKSHTARGTFIAVQYPSL